ncbi:hypothetical protein [Azonexus sp. IMCC34839]|uniref:hypothetical protein n=1 Tax=Azonexus sp. IMCC34839 TaxID=3133695 RepID=UPI00399B748F
MDKKSIDHLELRAASLVADKQTQHITEKTLELFNDAELLRKIADSRSRMSAEQAQGWLFEQIEVTKFNLDSLRKGSSLQAATTDSLGMTNHEVADVIIRKGKQSIKEFQLKSGNNAASTAFMLSDEKYAEVGLVGPSDQHGDVQRLYKARISTGTLKAKDYESAQQRLHKGVEAENVSSGGTEYSEALKATDPEHADKLASKFKRQGVATEMHRSGCEAGKIGAAISGGVSSISGLIRLAKGEAETGEIVAQVAVDAAKGYATSYVTTAMSKGITHATQAGLAKVAGDEFAKVATNAFTKSNAHTALAAGIVQSGKSLVRYLRGEIDDDELLSEVSHTAITGASTFYYGALGQAVIPIPVVGAFVGSTVGYFVGNMLHQSGLISLGEAAVVQAARERRERVEALCMTAIPLMRAHRLELEALMENHFSERRKILTSAFDELEMSMFDWEADKFTASLERVNNAFGTALPFKTFAEFDQFMKDDDQTFVL